MPNGDDLQELQRQIDGAKTVKNTDGDRSSSGLGGAMRLSLELIAAIAVGCTIGYFADQWLGTKPWLFILCFFLGCAAGFKNMLREAKKMANEGTEKNT